MCTILKNWLMLRMLLLHCGCMDNLESIREAKSSKELLKVSLKSINSTFSFLSAHQTP